MKRIVRALLVRFPWISEWVPPAARRAANRLLCVAIVYRGPFASFAAALRETRSYQDDRILQDVRKAIQGVLGGRARFEQDGVAFRQEPLPDLALSGLLLASSRAGGRLSVLDFGGSLGSHFLRWLPIFSRLPNLHWCVVEQAHFVDAGRELFGPEQRLSFELDIDSAAKHAPNAVLASSVLQYLDDPASYLSNLARLGTDVLIIDRFPISDDGLHHVLTQRVPGKDGSASYPLQVFPGDWLQGELGKTFELLVELPGRDAPIRAGRIAARYVGSVWILKR